MMRRYAGISMALLCGCVGVSQEGRSDDIGCDPPGACQAGGSGATESRGGNGPLGGNGGLGGNGVTAGSAAAAAMGGSAAGPTGSGGTMPTGGAGRGGAGGGGAGGELAAGGSAEAAGECTDCGDYACTDGTPVRFLAHQNAVPGDTTPFDPTAVGSDGARTSYECFHFEAPWEGTTQLIGHRPVLDNERIVRQWLLYASPNAPPEVTEGGRGSGCMFQADTQRVLIAGWAPGAAGGNLPPDVGQVLPIGPRTFVTLEVVYETPPVGTSVQDRSGVEVCLTDIPRANASTLHWLGAEGITIDPASQGTASDTCTPTLAQGETATIMSVWPRMRGAGTHTKIELTRAGGAVEVLHDAPFTLEDQPVFDLPQRTTVYPGDQLQATCTYQNDSATELVFGEGADEELCYQLVRAYPAGSLSNGKNGCFGSIICSPGAGYRCIDNEGFITAIGTP